jgi:hypothetical protein
MQFKPARLNTQEQDPIRIVQKQQLEGRILQLTNYTAVL